MSRLIVFGCSNTVGQGLVNPEKEVWGAVLANKLDKELINKAREGGSNKYIAYALNEFNFYPDDLIIIAWTFLTRSCVLYDPEESQQLTYISKNKKENIARFGSHVTNLRHNQETEWSEIYFKYFYNDYDSNFTNGVYMDFVVDLLIYKQLQFKQIFFHQQETPNHRHKNTETFPFVFDDFYDIYPKATDNAHMGPEGNKALGHAMFERIDRERLI